MMANMTSERTLVDQAIAWLADELGPGSGFTIERSPRTVPGSIPGKQEAIDALVDIRTQTGNASFFVEAKSSFAPRDVDRILGGRASLIARIAYLRFLVIAPWLSPRTREVLTEHNISYIDLSGNCRIQTESPPLYIRIDGAQKDPRPSRERVARLRGPRAARLVRILAEVAPPYGVRELAEKANLTPGYVSQLLETLGRDALVERDAKGQVVSVDYVRVLRRYAQTYDLLRANDAATYIANLGTSRTVEALSSLPTPTAVTGSFAAARIAPIAAPTLLALYCADRDDTAQRLNLLPADEGANVVLLRPFDAVVWDRTVPVDGARDVAPVQAALDCLTGNGRMPSEGEALIDWLVTNESTWRKRTLDDVAVYGRGPGA